MEIPTQLIQDNALLIIVSALISTFMSITLPKMWGIQPFWKMLVCSLLLIWLLLDLTVLVLLGYYTNSWGLFTNLP